MDINDKAVKDPRSGRVHVGVVMYRNDAGEPMAVESLCRKAWRNLYDTDEPVDCPMCLKEGTR